MISLKDLESNNYLCGQIKNQKQTMKKIPICPDLDICLSFHRIPGNLPENDRSHISYTK